MTMRIVPPPTSFLDLTRPRSGSIPVVSQSIIRPMVPVGARTVAWALRTPCSSAVSTQVSQDSRAAASTLAGARVTSMLPTAARCLRRTRRVPSRSSAKPSKGPVTLAISAEVR